MTRALPTIVVVDDSAEVRGLVTARLRLSGALEVVGEGANGMEAIGLAQYHQPSLLLLDLSMPGMDGLEALAGIATVAPDTRIVVYSGFEERGIATVALGMGAASFIEKSLPIERLADEVLAGLPSDWSKSGAAPERGRRRPLSLVDADGVPAAELLAREGDQEALDEHLESFRALFDQAAIGMATMTLSGGLVRANRALADLMRCEPADLVGVDYGRLMSGRSDLLDAALDDISHEVCDLVLIDHDVSGWPDARKARAALAAVRDSKGHALYVFLQVQDITAHAAAEEQLHRSEERLRLLIEAVQEYAIFMLDPGGTVTSWNSGAERIKGYRAHEIVGTHFRAFYPPEQRESRHPEFELEEALRTGTYEEEGWRVRKDGTQFWANVVITAVFDAAGTHIGFTKVTRDTTERRRAEQVQADATAALEAANAELESASGRLREAADDQQKFLAMTAHELRSPLTVLGGSAQTLADHWSDLSEPERQGLLDGMSTSARGMQRLLADLLAASRLDAHTLDINTARIPLADVVNSVVDTVRAVDRTADISVSVPDDLHVVADSFRLAQAIDNLVRNALAHGAPPVSITAEAVGDIAQIRVSDTGRGVDPSLVSRLFDKFATGDRAEGTGLGLFIARELAMAQGGDAVYEEQTADRPAGSFVVTIPLAD